MENSRFKIAIIGLGLMGGSLAYALHGFKNSQIVGVDVDSSVCKLAVEKKAVDIATLSAKDAISNADLVVFCVYPHSIANIISENSEFFKDNAIVTDIAGVKTGLYNTLIPILPKNIDYIGIHPMAGKEIGGFVNAEGNLFENTGFIISPIESSSPASVQLMKEIAEYIGAKRIAVTEYNKHDDIIAYTSDLMHISATAICKDFHEDMTNAHTAGSFRDCTRIASIDADMWTELLLDNRIYTIKHLDNFIANLSNFRNALENQDDKFIHDFLATACKNKKELLKR